MLQHTKGNRLLDWGFRGGEGACMYLPERILTGASPSNDVDVENFVLLIVLTTGVRKSKPSQVIQSFNVKYTLSCK